MLQKIINSEKDDLLRQITLRENEEEFNLPEKNRVGRPRICWILETAKLAWEKWSFEKDRGDRGTDQGDIDIVEEFDPSNKEMVRTLIEMVKRRQADKDNRSIHTQQRKRETTDRAKH